MLASLLAGLVAGTLHALSGPDHLAAITPLSISHHETSKAGGAWRVGIRWGLGHALGVAAMGALLLTFQQALDLDRFAWWSERLVGVVLIGLGVWGLRRATSRWVHSHHHEHDGSEHAHIHFHRPGETTETTATHRHSHTAFAVGLLHGFAGTTHLFGLLPALALPTAFATAYLGGYGAGNLFAMGGFAWVVGWAGARFTAWGLSAYRVLLGTASTGAIAVGAVWLFAR